MKIRDLLRRSSVGGQNCCLQFGASMSIYVHAFWWTCAHPGVKCHFQFSHMVMPIYTPIYSTVRVPVAPHSHQRLLPSHFHFSHTGWNIAEIQYGNNLHIPNDSGSQSHCHIFIGCLDIPFCKQWFLFNLFFSQKIFLRTLPMLENSMCLFPPRRSFLSLDIWQP